MDRVVIALGGNALLRRGAEETYEEMMRAARLAAWKSAVSAPIASSQSSGSDLRSRAAGRASRPSRCSRSVR